MAKWENRPNLHPMFSWRLSSPPLILLRIKTAFITDFLDQPMFQLISYSRFYLVRHILCSLKKRYFYSDQSPDIEHARIFLMWPNLIMSLTVCMLLWDLPFTETLGRPQKLVSCSGAQLLQGTLVRVDFILLHEDHWPHSVLPETIGKIKLILAIDL